MEHIESLFTRAGGHTGAVGPARIGTLLRDAGVLTQEKIERIVALQLRDGGLFGQLALRLYSLTQQDIDVALARQFGAFRLHAGQTTVSGEVLAAYAPDAPVLAPVRTLRSHLLAQRPGHDGRACYAVTSANRGDGRTLLSANLAVMLAHLGKPTLLVDADLHHPRQHALFGLDNRRGLAGALATGTDAPVQPVPGLPYLAVLTAGAPPPNAHDLLARPQLSQLLRRLALQFDAVIIDTPANADAGGAQLVAMGAGQALVLARQHTSAAAASAQLVAELQAARVHILGCILNAG